MLSYQHEYHFGNHADVLKHAVLALAIRALQRKDTPLRVLDAFAGSAIYELRSPEARRRPEFRTGISRIVAAADPPGELDPYLETVWACNAGSRLSRYPGSPRIARRLLRRQDQLTLIELHPRALTALRQAFAGDRQVHIHDRDAFEGLPALLPPPERRGLVLVDPSYEVKEDFRRVVALVQTCHRRWPGGTFLIWYPLIRDRAAARFPGAVAGAGIRKIFHAELQVQAEDFDGLRGSGLLIVNLPFGLERKLKALLPWLRDTLASPEHGRWRAEWLVPE
jgi:23S rRNA (adenine2030-N6)-methyltransferase